MKNTRLVEESKDNITPEYRGWILKAINYHFPNAKVILFGSRARGTNSPGSDVDLALDIGQPIKFSEMARTRVTLENIPLALKIDIVDMHNIPEELRQIILKKGIVWPSYKNSCCSVESLLYK